MDGKTESHMDYRQIRKYVDSAAAKGIVPGLESIRSLLAALGNPQKDRKVIHIAGTNGKGSTGAYLSYILAASGYRVGRYVSPAVFDECEKFQVLETIRDEKGKKKFKLTYIKEEEQVDSITKIKHVMEQGWETGIRKPTVFEIETAVAFLELTKRHCDILVLEAGMGGRLDATNVIDEAECSVIVSISMDHMEFLGDTLEKIAGEKAGIIKRGSFVVSSPQEPEVEKILRETAAERNSAIFFARKKEVKNVVHSLEGMDVIYQEENGRELKIHSPLLGVSQVENVLAALKTAWVLKEKRGYSITEETIKEGIENTVWHGRFEILRIKPFLIIDGAHNASAARKLAESIRLYFLDNKEFHGKMIFVIGIFKDKEVEKIVADTAELADDIFTVTPPSRRGLSSERLKEKIEGYLQGIGEKKHVESCGTVENGFKMALKLAGKEDAVVMFGSLSLFRGLSVRNLAY